jgi:hypothetical protein
MSDLKMKLSLVKLVLYIQSISITIYAFIYFERIHVLVFFTEQKSKAAFFVSIDEQRVMFGLA